MSGVQKRRADLDVRPDRALSLVPVEDQIARQISGIKMGLSVIKVQAERMNAMVIHMNDLLDECQNILHPQSLSLFPEAS